MLASGKTSRLYRTLVYEQRMATEIAASQSSRELGGYFQIIATAAPGRTLTELEQAISAAIDAFVDEGPTAPEMERCQAQAEANFVFRLQTVGGFGGKSDQLNAYNVLVGDPGFFERDLDRYRRVTGGSMQRAAREWLLRGKLPGAIDRLLLACIVEKRDVEMLFCPPASFNVGLCLAV